MDETPRPTLIFGKHTDPAALDEAAVKIAAAAYRQQHGKDPTPEMLNEARQAIAEKHSSGP